MEDLTVHALYRVIYAIVALILGVLGIYNFHRQNEKDNQKAEDDKDAADKKDIDAKISNAIKIAIQEAMQPVIASVDKLSFVVEMLRDDMKTQRETLHELELKVKQNETNLDNQHRRIKILEAYHKDRSVDNA